MGSAEAGKDEQALEALSRISQDEIRSLEKNFPWWASIIGLITSATLTGHREWAELLHELLLPYAERNAVTGSTAFFGCVHHHLGALATTLERHDEAEEHFEVAIERHEHMNARPFLALTQACFAQMLIARDGTGDAERAADLLARATATADELGLGAVTLRASRLSRRA